MNFRKELNDFSNRLSVIEIKITHLEKNLDKFLEKFEELNLTNRLLTIEVNQTNLQENNKTIQENHDKLVESFDEEQKNQNFTVNKTWLFLVIGAILSSLSFSTSLGKDSFDLIFKIAKALLTAL